MTTSFLARAKILMLEKVTARQKAEQRVTPEGMLSAQSRERGLFLSALRRDVANVRAAEVQIICYIIVYYSISIMSC